MAWITNRLNPKTIGTGTTRPGDEVLTEKSLSGIESRYP